MKRQSLQVTPYFLELNLGAAIERLPVIVKRHRSSRRLVVRYQPLQHIVSLTLPRYVSIRQGLRFVEEKRQWIAVQVKEKARRIPLDDGQEIPVLGQKYTISHIGGRGLVRIEDNKILVPGDKSFMQRRVIEWLKVQARAEMTRLVGLKTAQISVKCRRISLRDPGSRWGSCSAEGNLTFSWRLIFAPYHVLDYLVCHEVAHLKEHNHSAKFWQVVAQLCPEHEQSESWLKKFGSMLYGYE